MADEIKTTKIRPLGRPSLWLWLTDRDERRVYYTSGKYRFRLPWSRSASVRMMRGIGWLPLTQTTTWQPAEPFPAEHKRRPTAKRDGIGAWLRDEIAYLESIDRTEHGNGALAAYNATLKELERD